MYGVEIDFDWDDANIGHLARHKVLPDEAEQVILNDPVDLGMELVEGEERYLNIGTTVQGRVFLVVTTWREDRVRVVTAQSSGSFIFTTRNERGDRPWPRNSHPSRLRHKRPSGGLRIRILSRTALSKPKLRANWARELWRDSPVSEPAKPERRQPSQSGWQRMTSREPEPSPPRRDCDTRRISKCFSTKLSIPRRKGRAVGSHR